MEPQRALVSLGGNSWSSAAVAPLRKCPAGVQFCCSHRAFRLILNQMVQYTENRLDTSFAAISDATRRGVLEQLAHADASITDLADRFRLSLTGIRKHVTLLEQAGYVTTEKRGRVRTCRLGPRSMDEEAAWIARYHQRWQERFDALAEVVETLKQKATTDATDTGQ